MAPFIKCVNCNKNVRVKNAVISEAAQNQHPPMVLYSCKKCMKQSKLNEQQQLNLGTQDPAKTQTRIAKELKSRPPVAMQQPKPTSNPPTTAMATDSKPECMPLLMENLVIKGRKYIAISETAYDE